MTHTALVTGGASGLGAACAARLRAEGLAVTTLDVSDQADILADVTDEAALRLVADQIGPVDVLINSAGIVGANKPLLETSTEEWRRVFDVNVLGTVNTIRIFVPGMRERGWGRVVNFASMAGKDGNPNQSIYSASKAAVIGLTKSAGKELAMTGVLARPHHQPDPDEARRPARGGRRACRVSQLGPGELFHRRRLRHQRRPRHLLDRPRRYPPTTSTAGTSLTGRAGLAELARLAEGAGRRMVRAVSRIAATIPAAAKKAMMSTNPCW
jgi:NAD(P)-dependent dehydrogenase (short-subunit alcohol dehydrogenase family)